MKINKFEYIIRLFKYDFSAFNDVIIKIKRLTIGPAIATIISFITNILPFPFFLFIPSISTLNEIVNPTGIISIFSGLSPNIIPAIRCPISCKKAKIIIIIYISICLLMQNKIIKRNIFKSILNLI